MYQNMKPSNDETLRGVRCDVTNCYYNEHMHCSADEIKVGPQYAATSADTACATFRPR